MSLSMQCFMVCWAFFKCLVKEIDRLVVVPFRRHYFAHPVSKLGVIEKSWVDIDCLSWFNIYKFGDISSFVGEGKPVEALIAAWIVG